MKPLKKVVFAIVALLLLAFIAIQFVPVDRSNPPVTAPLEADEEVIAMLRESCFDCHSNETVWPWYSNVAPMSWLVARDVAEAREHFNFSEWGDYSAGDKAHLAEEAVEEVEEGKMPLPNYLRLHPKAKLTPDDFALLEAWAQEVEAAEHAGRDLDVEEETEEEDSGDDGHEGHDHD
jgi:hypothetical protein